eukprot:3526284-Ditylum_brightwellii.AAC.1
MASPSAGHTEAAKRVVRYIKGTKEHGIAFHSNSNNTDLAAYVKFPIKNDILAMSDAMTMAPSLASKMVWSLA